jgi:hypothetical protein
MSKTDKPIIPRQIFDKEHGYTKKECKCDTCMTGDYEGTCDRDYEYKEWLEEFYIKHSGLINKMASILHGSLEERK